MTTSNGHLMEGHMATRTVTITEAKANLLRLVTEIGDTGDEIIITRRGREVARLTPAGPFAELRGALILPDDISELYSCGDELHDPDEKLDRIANSLRESHAATRAGRGATG
jgi:prevent-host-death family protein